MASNIIGNIIADSTITFRPYFSMFAHPTQLAKLPKLGEASWYIDMSVTLDRYMYFSVKFAGFPKELEPKCRYKIEISCSNQKLVASEFLAFTQACELRCHLDSVVQKVIQARLLIECSTTAYRSMMSIPKMVSEAQSTFGSNAFNDPTFSDFTFNVQGKEFKVHKAILAAASPVMHTLFRADFDEAHTSTCQVNQFDPDIFEALIRFIYCGKLPDDIDNMMEPLLEAALYYEVNALKEICAQVLLENLYIGNAVETYTTAHLYDLEQLMCDSWAIIKRDILKISGPLDPLLPSEIQKRLSLL